MKKSSFLIAGRHAVTEALRNPNRNVLKVFLTEESKKDIHRNNQKQNILKNVKMQPSFFWLTFYFCKEMSDLDGREVKLKDFTTF